MERKIGRSVACGDMTIEKAIEELKGIGKRGKEREEFQKTIATELVTQSRTAKTIPWKTLIKLNATTNPTIANIGEIFEEVVRIQGSTDCSTSFSTSLVQMFLEQSESESESESKSDFNHAVRLLTVMAFKWESTSSPRMFSEKILRELCCPPPHVLFDESPSSSSSSSPPLEQQQKIQNKRRISVSIAAIRAGHSMIPTASESRPSFSVWVMMSLLKESTRICDVGIDHLVGMSDPTETRIPSEGVKAIFGEICTLSTTKEIISTIWVAISGTIDSSS